MYFSLLYFCLRIAALYADKVWDYSSDGSTEVVLFGYQSHGSFGQAVALWDKILVVGCGNCVGHDNHHVTGAMYIYHSFVEGHWDLAATFTPDNSEENDEYGSAVAIFSNVVAVGAPAGNDGVGVVYMYGYIDKNANRDERDGHHRAQYEWFSVAALEPEYGYAGDYFGCAVAVHRNITAVGSYGSDDVGSDSGAVYIFVQLEIFTDQEKSFQKRDLKEEEFVAPYKWVFSQKIYRSSGTRYELFGKSLSLKDMILVVGASGFDDRTGCAYVYQAKFNDLYETGFEFKPIDALHAQEQSLAGDMFGSTVVVAEDYTILVSSTKKSHNGMEHVGAVFIYSPQFDAQYNSYTWTLHQLLEPQTPVENGQFGYSMSINEENLVVGTFVESGRGKVYVYSKDKDDSESTLWMEVSKVDTSENIDDAFYGSSVSIYHNMLVVGASGASSLNSPDDYTNLVSNGAIHLYTSTRQASFSYHASDGLHHQSSQPVLVTLLWCLVAAACIAVVGGMYVLLTMDIDWSIVLGNRRITISEDTTLDSSSSGSVDMSTRSSKALL